MFKEARSYLSEDARVALQNEVYWGKGCEDPKKRQSHNSRMFTYAGMLKSALVDWKGIDQLRRLIVLNLIVKPVLWFQGELGYLPKVEEIVRQDLGKVGRI